MSNIKRFQPMFLKIVTTLIIVLCYSSCQVNAQDDRLPQILQDCYDEKQMDSLNSETSCLEKYMGNAFGDISGFQGMDRSAKNWVDSLGKTCIAALKESNRYRQGLRVRRHTSKRDWNDGERFWNRLFNPDRTFDPPDLSSDVKVRQRKEIRTLSETERHDFFEAINALKLDTSEKPNKYDVLALLHQDQALVSAHNGPNFLGWHRYYLCIMEEALRTKNSQVTLPYWDSRLDFKMSDPKESLLWTELFLGNGIGVVTSGPFALWKTPANNAYLRRNLTAIEGSLIDPVKLKDVFMQRFTREITSPTAAKKTDNIEQHHNGVHNWIGGHMSALETSPMDPAFFLHHCFIDYLWEKFREKQGRLGIDSETDYPAGDEPSQQPWRDMDNLSPSMKSIDGFSDNFTSTIYKYADAPTCENDCGGAFNGYLFCNKDTYECQSVSRNGFTSMDGFHNKNIHFFTVMGFRDNTLKTDFAEAENVAMTLANPPPPLINKFEIGIVDSRTDNDLHVLLDKIRREMGSK